MKYVAYACEYMQDSSLEQSSKICESKKEALAWIERMANGPMSNRHNLHFGLWELGKQLPLKEMAEKKEVEVVKKTTRKFQS